MDTVTVIHPCRGEIGMTDQTRAVEAGTYEVGDIDPGEHVGIIIDGIAHDEVVWLPLEPCGLATCLECDGRGEWGWPTYDGYESDTCEGCQGDGIVTTAAHAEQQAMMDRARDEAMRDYGEPI